MFLTSSSTIMIFFLSESYTAVKHKFKWQRLDNMQDAVTDLWKDNHLMLSMSTMPEVMRSSAKSKGSIPSSSCFLNWIPEFWSRSMLSCAYISSLKPTSIISSCETTLCHSPSVTGIWAMQKWNTQWGTMCPSTCMFDHWKYQTDFLNNALKLSLVYVPCIKWTQTRDI